jgi:uncharacterized membrane protein SpoIIM required for sporulation
VIANGFQPWLDELGPKEPRLKEPRLTLRSAEFRKGREYAWRRLDEIVERVENEGISFLSAEEAQELPLLYRAAVSSLSVARTIVLDRNLLLYLENLTLRAYLAVYGPRSGTLGCLSGFFRRGFPQSVRKMGLHLLAAFAALVVGIAAGYLLVRSDINSFHLLVPEGLAQSRGPASSTSDLSKVLFAPWPGFINTFIVFANFLFRHNTMVGIFSFGLGFMLGIPTFALLAYNGLILGAFVALHAEHGLAIAFIGWVSIHGVTEILAILLCGAAGLVVAEKILFPGPLPRLRSLAIHGRKAAGVAAGSVSLFFIAGILEGGFRQLVNNTPGRYVFALASAVLWLYYFGFAGKDESDAGAN